ncbi:MAG: phage holin family protein [Flavobacteriales bacterium]|nr:phage holin family protein [Flavobacteriales bacterium]
MEKYFNRRTVIQLLITTLALLVGAHLMERVAFDQPWIAVVTAIVLALLNLFVRPLLVLLTIPATLFTFGLFLLVINACIILFAREIVPGFHVADFWSALWLSLLISVVNGLFFNVKVTRYSNSGDIDSDLR